MASFLQEEMGGHRPFVPPELITFTEGVDDGSPYRNCALEAPGAVLAPLRWSERTLPQSRHLCESWAITLIVHILGAERLT